MCNTFRYFVCSYFDYWLLTIRLLGANDNYNHKCDCCQRYYINFVASTSEFNKSLSNNETNCGGQVLQYCYEPGNTINSSSNVTYISRGNGTGTNPCGLGYQ